MTWSSILTSLLYIVFILMPPSSAEKKMCTKRVEGVTTKVPQTRRIPAKCSNWDRAWTWVTHNDCGTKYQITYMELHQQNQYRLVYECCPGDEDCKREGQKDHESDERFLAITFGCASAAFIILIIIIVISVCRKKHAGFIFCPYRKEYENADESPVGLGCHGERSDPNDYVIGDLGEERKLVLESEYEEICDINPTLKGGATWDSMYQKTPSAPPQETQEGRESREPALPVASGNIEFREQPRNLPEEKLVEIDTNESENGTGMTNLINIEREREDVSSSTTSGGVLGVESSNISSDDSHQRVFENNHLIDKQSPVEILQPIKAEDQPQSGGDYKISDQNTDSALSDPNIDLVTSLKSGNDLSVVDTITEKDKTNPPVHSGNHDEVYEELH